MHMRHGRIAPNSRAAGFTILELMLASTIFAMILLVIAVGVIRVSTDYYRGITSSKTQSATQVVMSEVSQAIEFGRNITVLPANGSGAAGLCIDNVLYSYQIGQEIVDSSPNSALHQGYHALVASPANGCSAGTLPALPTTPTLPSGSRELLGRYMRLANFTISNSGDVYTIHITVIYGDDDLLTPAISSSTNWASEQCAGGDGSQFCAVSDLTTTVQQRLL